MAAVISLSLDSTDWTHVNDGVMGGASTGGMIAGTETGHLRFRGELSLENNGGFASVRRLIDDDLSGVGSVRLRVHGDGRTYQFRLRQDSRFDGVAWRNTFDTSGQWQDIELALSDFQPVFRGRPVPGAGKVVPGQIRQVGFMLADGQSGPFRLEIASIEFISGERT